MGLVNFAAILFCGQLYTQYNCFSSGDWLIVTYEKSITYGLLFMEIL